MSAPPQVVRARAGAGHSPNPADWLAPFETVCLRQPGVVALEIGDRRWRYADLHDWTLRLAALIGQHRRGERLRVGLLAARSLTATAGGLAVLAAGCTLLPLHPAQPAQRLRATLRHAGIAVLIVGDEALPLLQRLDGHAEGWRAVIAPESALDEPGDPASDTAWHDRAEMDRPAPWLLPPAPLDDELALLHPVAHPSGEPRAVAQAVEGQAAARAGLETLAPLKAGDRVGWVGDGGSEPGVADALQVWCCGATLQLLGESAGPDGLVAAGCSVLRGGSAIVTAWARSPALAARSLPGLRQVLWSGEPVTSAAAQAWAAAAPQAELLQVWGSAETGGGVMAYRWRRGHSERDCLRGRVPLGGPLPEHQAMLIDARGQTLDGACCGELLIRGPQLSPGDWPGLSPKDVRRPEPDDPAGGPWLRTGLEVERDAFGQLHAVRRRDGRLFPRGHRVECAELERALGTAAAADAVAVVAQPASSAVDPGLVAFVASREAPAVVAQRIRERLPEMLPRAWLPDEIRVLRQFPLDAARQVDRTSLAMSLSAAGAHAPASETAGMAIRPAPERPLAARGTA